MDNYHIIESKLHEEMSWQFFWGCGLEDKCEAIFCPWLQILLHLCMQIRALLPFFFFAATSSQHYLNSIYEMMSRFNEMKQTTRGGRCGFINRFLKQILQADWPYATGPARYDAKWIALNFGTWFKKKKISTSFRGFFHGASSNYIQSNNQHRSTRQPCTFLFKVLALFSISMSSKISIFKFGVHSSLIDSVVLRAASVSGALTRFQAVLVPWAETQTSASVTYFRPWSFGDDLWCWSSFHGFKISSHLLKYRTRTRFPISIFK